MSVIRSLTVTIGADLTGMQKGLSQASKSLKTAGKEMTAVGTSMTKGLTVPILGVGAALTGMAVKAGQGADELITLSNKTGLTTDALQEMEYAARFIDVEVETMTGSMVKLTKNMDMARRGSLEQKEAFKKLGVSYQNADGSLKNAKEVWAESIEKLGEMSNEADRDALAMSLFGKSAAELNPLIKAGSDELARLSQKAHEVGAVMGEDNVTALGKFDDQMQKLQAVLKTAGGNIGAAFLPVLEKLTPIFEEKIVPAIQKFAESLSGMITKFAEMSPGTQGFILTLLGLVVAMGPVLTVIGKMTTGIGGLVGKVGEAVGVLSKGGGLMSALSALIGPAGIAIAVIAAIAAAAYLIIKNWDGISEFFINLWTSVSDAFSNAWNGIKDFFTGLWDWVVDFFSKWGELILNTLFPFIGIPLIIYQHWDAIKAYFSDLWEGIKKMVSSASDSIVNVLTSWGTTVGDIFKSVCDGVWNGIKWTINLILGGIEKFVNISINSLNFLIKELNKVIGLVGSVIGLKLEIPTRKNISIPKLAQGAVIPPNDEFMAVLGDQNSGTNIETPLGTMIDAFETSLDNKGRNANIYIELDGKTIAKAIGKPLVDMIRVKTGVYA